MKQSSRRVILPGLSLHSLPCLVGAYPQSKSAGQLAAAESQGSMQLPPISSSASVSNLALAAPPSSSKWNPRTLFRASSKQLPRAGSGSVTPSPPATPVLEMTHRMPYVLRQVWQSTSKLSCLRSHQLLCHLSGIIDSSNCESLLEMVRNISERLFEGSIS